MCHKFYTANLGKVETQYDLPQLLCKAWMDSITNTISGYKVTGIYPVNRHALLDPVCTSTLLSAMTEVAYIPQYSPSIWCTRSCSTYGREMLLSPEPIVGEEFSDMFRDEEVELFKKWNEESVEVIVSIAIRYTCYL